MRRLTQETRARSPWVVFADVVLAALFLFVLFTFAMYLRFEKVAQQEELDRRRQLVSELIRDSVPTADSVRVGRGEGYEQRIAFGSDLLFGSCQHTLTPEGHRVVVRVGSLLKELSSYFESVEVEGHTDYRPPRRGDCPYNDNWELSSRRSTSVVQLLTQEAGWNPGGLSAVGRAEFHRITDPAKVNALPPQAQDSLLRADRRIELVLQYSEQDILDSLAARRASHAAGE